MALNGHLTKQYMASLAIVKSIAAFPISYGLNIAIVIPLVLLLDGMEVSPIATAMIIALPFVIVSVFKNYAFFYIADRYAITPKWEWLTRYFKC